MNPAVTLTFLRLGKIMPWDAAFYITAQFVGGVGDILFSKTLLGAIIHHPSVNHVVTVPGPAGAGIAFVAEWPLKYQDFEPWYAEADARSPVSVEQF